jgi:hypothetical protein
MSEDHHFRDILNETRLATHYEDLVFPGLRFLLHVSPIRSHIG